MNPLTVLLTGGAGFVGSAISRALAEQHPDWQLTILDVKPVHLCPSPQPSTRYMQVDIRDAEQVLHAVQHVAPQALIHTASIVPLMDTRYDRRAWNSVYEMNVNGTRNILAAAKACGVQAFVYTSSYTVITDDVAHDYPNMNEEVPIPRKSLIYGESKAAAEKLVLEANSGSIATCALRASITFGEDDYQLIPSIHACIAKYETPWVIGHGDNLYDFTYVGNVADAHVLAVENLINSKSAAGEAMFISNGQPITFRDFCLAIWAAFDVVPPYQIYVPRTIASFMGFLAEWFTRLSGTPTTLCRGSVKDAAGTRYANTAKATRFLGYKPRVDMWDAVRVSCEAQKVRLGMKIVKR